MGKFLIFFLFVALFVPLGSGSTDSLNLDQIEKFFSVLRIQDKTDPKK